jgi:two-component system, LuxR family, response regulator FixJ
MCTTSAVKYPSSLNPPSPVLHIVDDDEAVRDSLKFALKMEGFAVRLYSSASQLLGDSEMPSDGCLLIDYYLPDANGLQLLADLRGRHINLPAFIITGHPSLVIRRRAAEAGIRLVEKPLLGDGLANAIREALDGQVSTT